MTYRYAPLQPTSNINSADLAVLLRRVAGRDRDAFSTLYGGTSAKLYGIVLRILRRRDLSDEVLQEVYVKIWDRAGDFDASRGSPVTWMATIARNQALDEARRVQSVSIEDMPAGFDIVCDAPVALEAILASEEGRRLHNCLQRLEPHRRDLVVQAYIEGASREELGRRFGAPVPTIKTWLHRSLAQLKECLGS
jgi:RNA polymerase sigma-70 factor (ECF subfamily)